MDIETKLLTFKFGEVSFDFRIVSSENIISQNVEKTGMWEDISFLFTALIGDGGVFVDIGANVGINSLYAKQFLAECARLWPLSLNRAIMPFLFKIQPMYLLKFLNLAIADKDGTVGFAGTGTNAHIEMHADKAVSVRCVTLMTWTTLWV